MQVHARLRLRNQQLHNSTTQPWCMQTHARQSEQVRWAVNERKKTRSVVFSSVP